jgi:predicted RNA binding protein YcfA (HicA-like mRNA interferase family)
MSKLPEYRYGDVIKKIKKVGFEYDRNAKGSHEIWYNPENKRRTTIPNHPTPIKKGTLREILRQIGFTPEEFQKL